MILPADNTMKRVCSSMMINSYLSGLLVFSSLFLAVLTYYAYSRREAPGNLPFAGFTAAAAIYSFGYGVELSCHTLEAILLCNKIQYVGVAYIPLFSILFAVQYTGSQRWLPKPVIGCMVLLSTTTLLLDWTNSYHRLYYPNMRLDRHGSLTTIFFEKSTWYGIQLAYLHGCVLVSNILLLKKWLHSPRFFRQQSATVFMASLIPWLACFVYVFEASPFNLDLSPFALILTGSLLALGLFRYQILDITPVARDRIFETMKEGVLVFDHQNRLIDFNPAASSILPDLSSSQIGMKVESLFVPYPSLRQQIESTDSSMESIELNIKTDSDCRYYQSRLTPIVHRTGKQMGKMIVLNDITQHVDLLEKINRIAATDELTGIYNRRYFMRLAQEELYRADRYGRPVSLIIWDMDHFKQINDTYGHIIGDRVLQTAVNICRDFLRESDILGRFGGEEFIILLPETPPTMALDIADRLCKRIAIQPIDTDISSLNATASFGVFGMDVINDINLEVLVKKADKALYQAKNSGRNRAELEMQ